MQMSEAKRKALTIPPPRKPSAAQIAAHHSYCTNGKKTILTPDLSPKAERSIKEILRGR